MTRELIDKVATLEQTLPTANRSKRGILSTGGKTLKFLFSTALSNDIVKLDQKVEGLKTQQGNLLHDVTNQITVTRDLDDNIKNNAKRMTTLIGTMKQQATSSRRVLEAIVTRENGTTQMVEQNALISSYIREIELVLSKLYTDIGEIFFALELAQIPPSRTPGRIVQGVTLYRTATVQSAGFTVTIFQLLPAVLLTRADGSLLVGRDALPDAPKGRVAFTFRIKQSCWTVLNICVIRCFWAGNVSLVLCDFRCLPGYFTRELECSCSSSGNR
jgi:hypothetical protein